MASDGISKDKPYRIAPGVGQGKWKVYGMDDHQQERYLGCIVEREGAFFALDVSTPLPAVQKLSTVKEAAEVLYEKCMDTGYLNKEDPNYLKSSDERGDKT